jgi:hypothetical protein
LERVLWLCECYLFCQTHICFSIDLNIFVRAALSRLVIHPKPGGGWFIGHMFSRMKVILNRNSHRNGSHCWVSVIVLAKVIFVFHLISKFVHAALSRLAIEPKPGGGWFTGHVFSRMTVLSNRNSHWNGAGRGRGDRAAHGGDDANAEDLSFFSGKMRFPHISVRCYFIG